MQSGLRVCSSHEMFREHHDQDHISNRRYNRGSAVTTLCKGFGRVWRRWLLTSGVQMFELPGKILITTINLPPRASIF